MNVPEQRGRDVSRGLALFLFLPLVHYEQIVQRYDLIAVQDVFERSAVKRLQARVNK